MLDAGDQIAASRENVREKGILCVLDSISVANDRYGEHGHSCTRLELGVPSHCDVNDDRPTASGVKQVQCLVPDRQFAKCKIATNKNQTQACCDQQSAFQVPPANELGSVKTPTFNQRIENSVSNSSV